MSQCVCEEVDEPQYSVWILFVRTYVCVDAHVCICTITKVIALASV